MNSFHDAANFRQSNSGYVIIRGISALYLGKVSSVEERLRCPIMVVTKLVDFYQKIKLHCSLMNALIKDYRMSNHYIVFSKE